MNDNGWSHGPQYHLAVSQHSTFGELTNATMDSIADALRSMLGSKLKRCTLLDVGSGRGKLAMCVANRVSLRAAMGIEIDAQLHSFAQENSRCTQLIFVNGDLNSLTSLRGTNIILGMLLLLLSAAVSCIVCMHCMHAVCRVRSCVWCDLDAACVRPVQCEPRLFSADVVLQRFVQQLRCVVRVCVVRVCVVRAVWCQLLCVPFGASCLYCACLYGFCRTRRRAA